MDFRSNRFLPNMVLVIVIIKVIVRPNEEVTSGREG
jgi:hypothetical protein